MAISETAKKIINGFIFERAYEIEEALTANDFMLAKIAGFGTNEATISDFALKVAIREAKHNLEAGKKR